MLNTDLDPSVVRFFVSFSRLEYALKRAGYVNSRSSNGAAEVDWNRFAKKRSKAFDDAHKNGEDSDLTNAVRFMRTDPPRKLVLIDQNNEEQLYWKRSAPSGEDLEGLLLLIRRVRNNLFHGEKPETSVGGDRRGLELLDASQHIVDACIQLDPPVKRYFERYAEPFPRFDENDDT